VKLRTDMLAAVDN